MQASKKQIDFLAKLQKKKYRDEHQKFLLENAKVIWEEYSNPLLDSVYVTETFLNENNDFLDLKNVFVLSNKDLKKVSSQVNPVGIVALYNIPKIRKFNFKSKYVLLLDSISDPGNMGTILRTADWFGFKDIFLSNNCVDAYNFKVVAASMGSIFNINIFQDCALLDLAQDLKKEKYQIVATDLMGKEAEIDNKKNIALVIGNEAKGVDKKILALADQRLKIKKFGQAESLNAAVAAGIVMNDIRF